MALDVVPRRGRLPHATPRAGARRPRDLRGAGRARREGAGRRDRRRRERGDGAAPHTGGPGTRRRARGADPRHEDPGGTMSRNPERGSAAPLVLYMTVLLTFM